MLPANKLFNMHTMVLVTMVWKALSLFLPLVFGFPLWRSSSVDILCSASSVNDILEWDPSFGSLITQLRSSTYSLTRESTSLVLFWLTSSVFSIFTLWSNLLLDGRKFALARLLLQQMQPILSITILFVVSVFLSLSNLTMVLISRTKLLIVLHRSLRFVTTFLPRIILSRMSG